MRKILKNFSYTLVSNVISFLISAMVTFFVPKRLGLVNYSYFQLYLFYINYAGVLHFGWVDGIYLRYGGEYYENLNFSRFSGQFKLYCILELFLSIGISLLGIFFSSTQEKSVIFLLLGFSIILLLPKTFLLYILQGTNRIKEYAFLVLIEKIVYIIVILFAYFLNIDNFVIIIMGDLLGKMCALIYAIYQCRDIIFAKVEPFKSIFIETKLNITVGIKLMFANFASSLIIGIVRGAIEHQWDIETFGKVSLTMSVSNMLMLLVRAIALLMFPVLRRTDTEQLSELYIIIRTAIMIPLLGLLVLYYPVNVILSSWLPHYADGLRYMALLFPMCIFESKMSMLSETYMKTLRMEKQLLLVNAITVLLSAVATILTVFCLKNLDLAVVSIVALLAFRCVLSEKLLSKMININVNRDINYEVGLTVCFIIASWFLGGIEGLAIYIAVYIGYLMLKKEDIKIFMNMMKSMIGK